MLVKGRFLIATLLASCLAPGCAPEMGGEGGSAETFEQAIVNGTREPQEVDLSEGEKLAIGWLHQAGFPGGNFCTGTVIGPNVVITASHCTNGTFASQIGFGVGLRPAQAQASFNVSAIHNHPSRDAAILVLSEDVTSRVPGLIPIPANRSNLDRGWEGRTVEASGYGETRDVSRDGRWFATLLLESVQGASVVVNGQGQRGICFGDSGGPLLSEDSQGRPIVLAVESAGDDSCVGRDTMTRLDAITGWMDPITGPLGDTRPPREDPTPDPDPDPVPDVSPEPEPDDVPPNACGSVDFLGQCDGDVARWCQEGLLFERDCAALGTECTYISDQVGFLCDCGDVDYIGRCNGEVAEYCDNGRLARIDCRRRGQSCGFVNDQTGYFCSDNPSCGDVDERGYCAGVAVVTCQNGRFARLDCGGLGESCTMASGRAVCTGDGAVVPPPNGNDDAAPDPPNGGWPDEGNGGAGWGDDQSAAPVAQQAVCQAIPGAPGGRGTPWAWALAGVLIGVGRLRRAR